MDRGAWQPRVYGVARVRHDLATKPPPPLYIVHPKGKKTNQQELDVLFKVTE